jgi:hypothetical protein
MTIRKLLDAILLSNLPESSEVVVHRGPNGRDYMVDSCRSVPLEALYFGGAEPSSTEPRCLVLDIE